MQYYYWVKCIICSYLFPSTFTFFHTLLYIGSLTTFKKFCLFWLWINMMYIDPKSEQCKLSLFWWTSRFDMSKRYVRHKILICLLTEREMRHSWSKACIKALKAMKIHRNINIDHHAGTSKDSDKCDSIQSFDIGISWWSMRN